MKVASPDELADIILNRKTVFSLEIDSSIRSASQRLTARALFELLARVPIDSPEFAETVNEIFRKFPGEGTSLIGFSSEMLEVNNQGEYSHVEEYPETGKEYFLKLIFANEDAAYYQFPLFPNMDAPYILGGARKRAGAIQYLCIEVSTADHLQSFIDRCRQNPHLVEVAESSSEEFRAAPSHAV